MDERAVSDHAGDLAFAHELADAAARVTLGQFGDRLAVSIKDDATPVTRVDGAAEGAIRDRIGARFPDDGVLGEEGGRGGGSNGRVWIVDPIDGTKLYADGIPLWTTLIALQVDEEPVLGVADAPALGERYHAVRGAGAWRGPKRLCVSEVERLSEAFVTHSGIEEWQQDGRDDDLLRIARSARQTRGLSDAWGHLLVAQGSVEALLEHEPCYPWDWAATRVIVEEAGGTMTTLTGGPPTAGGDLLVSNGAVHQEIIETLARRRRRVS